MTTTNSKAFNLYGPPKPKHPKSANPGQKRKELAARRKANEVAKRQRHINYGAGR